MHSQVFEYRALKCITFADGTPVPLIEALEPVSTAKIFLQIELVGAYHPLRIGDEDCHKKEIHDCFGLLEWHVVCFGLTNDAAAFSRLNAFDLKHLNGDRLFLYLDNIPVYSTPFEEHKRHLHQLFTALANMSCMRSSASDALVLMRLNVLALTFSGQETSTPDPSVNWRLDWRIPMTLNEFQQFVSLCNFYRSSRTTMLQ